jgi:enoyl-CoA hydratase/carnithine racemase
MTAPAYAAKYAHFARLDLEADGLLTIKFHTDGGAWVLRADTRDLLVPMLFDVSQDRSVRVVILQGTGEVFCETLDPTSLMSELGRFGPEMLDNWRFTGNSVVRHLINIEAPIILCLNGHLKQHAEIWMAADIIVAEPTAELQDFHIPGGQVPGGNARVVWESLLGYARARQFLLLGESLTAATLQQLGVVHSLHERAALEAAGRAIAAKFLTLNKHVLRYAKASVVERLRQQLSIEEPYTQALVMLGAHSVIPDLLKTQR